MSFDLRHVRYFIAVAEEMHFRRAAERLGVAQPALSRAIKYLESDLDVILFERTNRSVRITRAGEVFLEGCRELVASIDYTVSQTQLAHRGQLGSLRIGYTDNAIAGVLPIMLKAFQEREPGITVTPFHGPTIDQLRRLEMNEIDVGFITGPVTKPGYEMITVQSERFVCIAYASHPITARQSIRLGELSGENFVHGSSAEWKYFHDYLFSLCRRAGFEPKIVQQAFNTAGILGLVASGMGLTVLTENSTIAMPPGLVVIPIEDVDEKLTTCAIWKMNKETGPRQLFKEYLFTEWEHALDTCP